MSLMYRMNRSGLVSFPGELLVSLFVFQRGTIFEYLVSYVCQEGIYPVESVVSDSVAF